jgi:phage-related protein
MMNIVYNGYDFFTNNILVKDVFHEDVATRTLDTQAVANRDGFAILEDRFAEKMITVRALILEDTREDVDNKINELKQKTIINTSSELAITYENEAGYLFYTGTVSEIRIPRNYYNDSHVEIEMVFLCQPFANDGILQVITQDEITTTPFRADYEFGGTAELFPQIKVTVNSETDLTILEFSSGITGDGISVTPSGGYSAGDVLIINTSNSTVFLNGVETDYTGIFPRFRPDVINRINLISTSTAHDLKLELIFKKKYS